MLDLAKRKVVNEPYNDIRFIEGDVSEMPFSDNEFDGITIGFGFRNLTYNNSACQKHMSEINRVLKQGGRFYILESAIPRNPLVRVMYNLYLRLILLPLGGLISGNWRAYRYLALSSANYFSPDEIKSLLIRFGFIPESARSFFMGASNLIVAKKERSLKSKLT
jgi:demethylmenaquinone methyltransferase/2-methoxy-6-polyprenyl-1,4-benzoquinol methylase